MLGEKGKITISEVVKSQEARICLKVVGLPHYMSTCEISENAKNTNFKRWLLWNTSLLTVFIIFCSHNIQLCEDFEKKMSYDSFQPS